MCVFNGSSPSQVAEGRRKYPYRDVQYCITVPYKLESCPDNTIMNLGNDLDTRIHIVKRSGVSG